MKKIFFVSFLFLLLFGYAQNAQAGEACCVCNDTKLYRMQPVVDGCSAWCESQKSTLLGSRANDAAFIKQYCGVSGTTDADSGSSSGGGLPNPLEKAGETLTVEVLASRIINYVLGLVGTISLLLFIYGGITWMTSAGSSDKVKKGRDIIVWAVIGMAVVFMSYMAVKFIIQAAQGTLK